MGYSKVNLDQVMIINMDQNKVDAKLNISFILTNDFLHSND